MKIKVAVEPAIYPDLHSQLAALPERSRAERLRALAAQALAVEQGRAPVRAAHADRPIVPSVQQRAKSQAGQPLAALPVASGAMEGNAGAIPSRLSDEGTTKGGFSQARQALAALPVASEDSDSKPPFQEASDDGTSPVRSKERPSTIVASTPGATEGGDLSAPREQRQSNQEGAFNLAVRMARRGVFAG